MERKRESRDKSPLPPSQVIPLSHSDSLRQAVNGYRGGTIGQGAKHTDILATSYTTRHLVYEEHHSKKKSEEKMLFDFVSRKKRGPRVHGGGAPHQKSRKVERERRRVESNRFSSVFLFLLLERLASKEEVHRSKDIKLSTTGKSISGSAQHLVSLSSSLGGELKGLKNLDSLLGEEATSLGVFDVGKRPSTLDSIIPGNIVSVLRGSGSHVVALYEFESSRLEGVINLLGSAHIGETITGLDLVLDATVLLIGGVILISHNPVVGGEVATGLEDLVHLLETSNTVGGVACGLDGVDGIDGVLGEVEVHEVTLDSLAEVLKVVLDVQDVGTFDLVVVVVDAGNIGTRETGNSTHGSTDTTAEVEDMLSGAKAERVSKEVLMTGERSGETLSREAGSKMEALSPSVLVEIGDEVVVVVHHGGVLLLSLLDLVLVVAHVLVALVEHVVVYFGREEGGKTGKINTRGVWYRSGQGKGENEETIRHERTSIFRRIWRKTNTKKTATEK